MSAQIAENICPEGCPDNKIRADIEIDQHYTYKIYTPGSLIAGHVTISTPSDVLFHNIDILFVGSAATRNFVQPDPVCTTRPFLKLCMPIDDASFPSGHLFKASKMYTIPFHFVVPAQLLLGSCRHRCKNAAVQERHLRLPPSMGFPNEETRRDVWAAKESIYPENAAYFREAVLLRDEALPTEYYRSGPEYLFFAFFKCHSSPCIIIIVIIIIIIAEA